MTTLPVELVRSRSQPLPVQLSDQVRDLVLSGTLNPGDRLPSTRALAADLGVSRSVTEQAYEQLLAEGWLAARRGAGTFVASGGSRTATGPARSRPRAAPRLIRLDAGTPWIDPRHAAGWRRAWREVSVASPPRGYADPAGLPELRTVVADRLARSRGITLDAEEVVLTAGTTDGLRQLLAVLPAGGIGIEDPGYRAAVACAGAAGRMVRDLPAATLPALDPDLAAAYVTPAHQHPLGLVMPAATRVALLAGARATGTLIVEDDYDSELRYDVAPIPALASLDRTHVAYLGTTAKSVGPSLRIGWLVPPPHLLDPILRHRTLTHDAPSWPAQHALLHLLREGWVDKVLRTARRVYAERAPRVADALSPSGAAAGPSAGMYSTWLMPEQRARRARDSARRAGFDVPLLADYCRSSRLTGLVVGFGGVTDHELDLALRALARGLDQPEG